MKSRFLINMASLVASLALSTCALADVFPARPVKIIVPYTSGDAPDVLARLIGQKVAERLGQPVVIDNRPGASGQMGLDAVARSAPDGYTVGVGFVTNLALAPHTYRKIPYDPVKDFSPVALAATQTFALVSRTDAPYRTVDEMVRWAKANPEKLTLGMSSTGGLPQMAFEQLARMTAFKFVGVPYKGNGPMINDLVGGRIDVSFISYAASAALIDGGRLRLLGLSSPARDPKLPDLPTIGESVKGYTMMGWIGFVAPAGTPAEAVRRLNQELNAALQLPEVQKTMATLGFHPVRESPDYFGAFLKSENEKFGRLVREIGYQPE
jgi:tripartite-type tricarboxylate transporter receptor subunit TctC